MVEYLLDSSVIIEAIRLYRSGADEFLKTKYDGNRCISFVTVTELFSGQSAQKEKTEKYLRYLIGELEILPITLETSILAGRIRCFYKIDTPDAIIAASAIVSGAPLVTHNKKDFNKVPNLKIISPR